MKFIDQYQQLKELFNLAEDRITIPETQVRIENLEFQSTFEMPDFSTALASDDGIVENIRFRYPVFMPGSKIRSDKVIILLHGLNERSWEKHLTGGKYLCEKTGKAVLMFPLSFHINRGLPEWSDSRKMAGLLELRRLRYPQVKDSSLANLALSDRLTDHPERFLISGMQSMQDLLDLIKMIRRGDHPLFDADTRVDLFAYSIGCMLLQALMASNPENLLDKSKVVFFAGGSLFDQMQGISRYIMDSVAFDSLRKFYLNHFTKKAGQDKLLQPWFMEHKLSKAFRSCVTLSIEPKERKEAMQNFSDNLMVIALRDDRIMPIKGIRQAVGEKFFRSDNFRILHFPYGYMHENPFPVLYRKIDEQVNQAFESVFAPIMQFFMNTR